MRHGANMELMTLARALRTFSLATIFALAPLAARADDATPAGLTGPQIGAPAPAFSLPTIAGKRVDLASYAGKVLVMNVWAT